MVRWLCKQHRTAAWWAIGALVVLLFSGDATRLQAIGWKVVLPSSNEQSPSEENEEAAEEMLAAPQPRRRARPQDTATTNPGHLPRQAVDHPKVHNSLHRFGPVHSTAFIMRGVPLRC